MVMVKPFKALRPEKKFVEKVASLPYDVMNSEEAREMAKGNEYSFLHVIKPEIDFDPDINIYDERVYLKGKENLDKFQKDNILKQDSKPCYYIYRQIMGKHSQIGVVAAASVEEYQKDIIKKHEKTRKDKEDDRMKHVLTLEANTGPVFLTYKNKESIDQIINSVIETEAEYDFITDDKIQHTVWVISDDENIDKLKKEFDSVDILYVADGHHRSASASRVKDHLQEYNNEHTGLEDYNFFLSVIFPDNQMYVMDYNRAVKDLNGFTTDQYFEKISERFNVEKTDEKSPKDPKTFGMYIDGQWYKLTPKEGVVPENDPVESLDVSILQNNLLDPILNIKDPRTDKRIHFIGGIRGMKELERIVDNGDYKVSFSLYATTIKELMDIADADKIMPPKSTWFEPKLRSGLFVHKIQ